MTHRAILVQARGAVSGIEILIVVRGQVHAHSLCVNDIARISY